MPSSSLVEVEAEVGVEVEVGVGEVRVEVGHTFSVGWVGGDLETKANLNSSCN